ncbi:hypothetical protein M2T28_14210 [Elizabethkingia miricola]|uniref:hypothetical protein n=1 Tax=Elizabethkingia miricola TaxID=172045 RepID=UPI002018E211|nr:hypothetical protein [Elizabethkingia miricola]MCL1653774.1 hypothetical protein [Elizabethkingia miricola]
MRLILYTIFLYLFVSCASRTSKVNINKGETVSKDKEIISEKTSEKVTSEILNNFKITESGYGFTLEPISGNALFDLSLNGINYKGSTSGKLNFTNSAKETIDKTVSKSSKETKIIKKTERIKYYFTKWKIKNKETIKTVKYTIWFFLIFAFTTIVSWELLKLLAKTYFPKPLSNLWSKRN